MRAHGLRVRRGDEGPPAAAEAADPRSTGFSARTRARHAACSLPGRAHVARDQGKGGEGMRTRHARSGRRAGQGMTEYVILVGFLVGALAVIFGAFPHAIAVFWQNVSGVLSLPVLSIPPL